MIAQHLILAFGFANAAVLGWLAAAAAPILIHLWMKRVHRETPWAAVRFLQAAIKRHSRRLRLQEWLLLAIRTAIILLVVLAASKPLLEQFGGLLGAGVRTHRVLVIDASLSMRYRHDEGDLLSSAKRLAAEFVDQSGASDAFSLCVMADPLSAPIAAPTSDAEAVKRAIGVVEPTDATSNLAATFEQLSRLLGGADSNARRFDRLEVVFFSDLTQTAWRPLVEGLEETAEEASGARKLFDKLADKASLSLVDVGMDEGANTAVIDFRVVSGSPTTQEAVRFVGSVQRFGVGSDRQTVELLVDGLAVASQPVELDGAEPVPVEFSHRFQRPGWRELALRISEDRLPADDLRLLGIEVKPIISVLCVEGRPGAARYVADALNPSASADATIQPQVVSDAEFATLELSDFDAVFFCNVAELSAAEGQQVGRYLRAGGGVTFFLGDRVRPDRYNEVFARQQPQSPTAQLSPRLRGGGLETGGFHAVRFDPNHGAVFRQGINFARLSPEGQGEGRVTPAMFQPQAGASSFFPVSLGEAVSQSTYGIDPLGYRHPIVAPFRGRERAGLLTTPVERYFKLQRRPSAPQAETVMATTGGDPLMVASPVGAGRVVVVGTAGSLASIDPATGRPWTAMPAWPSFVPIIRELVRYTSGASLDQAGPLVGERIVGRAAGWVAGDIQVLRPDGDIETITAAPDGSGWVYPRADRAGFYKLSSAGADKPLQIASVNPNPRESDVTRLSASELPADLAVRRVGWQEGDSAPELVRPVGLHQGLLLGALALVLLETWLAFRFGKGPA